ncbi:MAG: hypothetical protein WCP58_03820, partial [bacterium]
SPRQHDSPRQGVLSESPPLLRHGVAKGCITRGAPAGAPLFFHVSVRMVSDPPASPRFRWGERGQPSC